MMDCPLKIEQCPAVTYKDHEQIQTVNLPLLSSMDKHIKEPKEQIHNILRKHKNYSMRRHFNKYPKKYKIFSFEMKKLCVQEVRNVKSL